MEALLRRRSALENGTAVMLLVEITHPLATFVWVHSAWLAVHPARERARLRNLTNG
jgi:hypothetical protein